MEENEFNTNLADMNEVFNNKTFRYRINGFAHACRMEDIKVTKDAGVLFATPIIDENGNNTHSYFISVNVDEVYGKNVTLNGNYDDLYFTFINHYDKQNLDKKIVDLPFFISLSKVVDDETHKLTIETIDGIRTKFVITKSKEFKDRNLSDEVIFYANILDFSKVLKIVKSFVYNPRLCFSTYNEIMQQQKVVFTSSMVDKMVMQDENLDKPVGRIKSIFRRIIG